MSELIAALQQDHLSELLRGQKLPLPALDLSHVEFILALLQQAYEDVKADYPVTVSSGDEMHLNSLMVDRMNNFLGEDPLASLLIRAVSRGTETKNYDASRFEMRPDIQIVADKQAASISIDCRVQAYR